MENGPFTDDFPIKPPFTMGFSIAMLNNQRVTADAYHKYCSFFGVRET
jgi:hypothetical protein